MANRPGRGIHLWGLRIPGLSNSPSLKSLKPHKNGQGREETPGQSGETGKHQDTERGRKIQALNRRIPPLTQEDIAYLAAAQQLVVAMDFDGTLAPFSDDPSACRAEPGAMEALHVLAALPGTHVMVISGRNLQQLAGATELDPATAARAGAPGVDSDVIRMIGSHGAEAADGPALELSDFQRQLLDELEAYAEQQASRCAGMWVERKPLSIGLHTRTAQDRTIAADAVAAYQSFALQHSACSVTLGKDILEVAVSTATKGGYVSSFLEAFERATGHPVDAVVFAGDDTTDETVLSKLNPSRDIGIKVGDGDSAANRHLNGTTDVRDFLVSLLHARSTRR